MISFPFDAVERATVGVTCPPANAATGWRQQLSRLTYIIHVGSANDAYKSHINSAAWIIADASARALLHHFRAKRPRPLPSRAGESHLTGRFESIDRFESSRGARSLRRIRRESGVSPCVAWPPYGIALPREVGYIDLNHPAGELAGGSTVRSVADECHQDVGQDTKSQAHHDHAANFGKDFTWSRTGAEIVHAKWMFRFVPGRESERAAAKMVHGVLERGDVADMEVVPV